jgi:hypothetical protein
MGQTATQDVLDTYAIMAPDHKSYVIFDAVTEVETKTYSNGNVDPEICDHTGSGFFLQK